MSSTRFRALLALCLSTSILFLALPRNAAACACGCGIFDVGTASMFPNSSGGMFFLEWDYTNQTKNWNGNSQAASSSNPDQQIRTLFITLGGQYMFNRTWGLEIELPAAVRKFETIDPTSGGLDSFNRFSMGDIRLRGIYTGFSPDMTSGITYGLKLPTGDSTFYGFDPDTEIGSGSTDLLLGAYHLDSFGSSGLWNWFAQINLDEPVLTQNGYFPGSELDAGFGSYYNGLALGNTKIAPMLQLLASIRSSDHGGNPAVDPLDTGYDRLFIAPAIDAIFGNFQFFGSVAIPFYQYMNGMQLVAPALFKTVLSYSF